MVTATQQQRRQFRIHRDGVVAHLIEHGFDRVRESNDAVQPEKARRPLDGVRGPKHGIDCFRIDASLGESEQAFLHLREQFLAFNHIGFQCRIEIHVRASALP